MEWSKALVVRLVEEYRRRPELWDSRNDLYRVQSAKHEAWAALAHAFGCDVVDARMKLNSVFASYRREKAKIRNGGRSTWPLYQCLKFLPNHVKNIHTDNIKLNTSRSTSEPEEQGYEQYSDEDIGHEQEQDALQEVLIKEEPFQETFAVTKRYRQSGHSKPRLKVMKRRVQKESSVSQLDNRLVETLRLLRRSGISRKKDECDSFGEYIADSLRKHDERTQSMIKQAINNILFEQEMKKYNSVEQYTVVIASDNENPLILGDRE